MKIPKFLKPKKLRAATARRSVGAPAEVDYEEMSEPNMKLSRALLIVLLLHVVAVSGIIAFNAIKTRQTSFVAGAPANPENNPNASGAPTIESDASNRRSPLVQKETTLRETKSAKDERAKSAEQVKEPARSGKVYTVVRGDNPVTIAKKLKVSYDDLLALNQIEDPRKLKIGQKLLVPSKNAKAKARKE
ncbi:MAG TPA: LysM domain-containing protein [Candidatus Sulfotelmatobacter sp.]|jgi:LysM repeat protein|nr:LysM domain-containing protein [Candidatus Sulfotelmatobacter sp.]